MNTERTTLSAAATPAHTGPGSSAVTPGDAGDTPDAAPSPIQIGAAPFTGAAARVRVGTDIVAVKGVAESIAKFGDRYLARVFTPAERAYCTAVGRDAASHLAARFAAKEATMKALRPEGDAIDWHSIEVVRTPGGWCEISVTGAALALAERAGITGFSVSLSHDGEYATAVVVAERAA